MSYKNVVLFFLFFSLQAFADHNQDELSQIKENCYKNKHNEDCSRLVERYTFLKQWPEALKVSLTMCDSDPKQCNQLMYLAEQMSPKTVDEIIEKLSVKCKSKTEVCNDLAYALESIGKNKEAIAAAKLYFDKYKSGIYAWFSYRYGDKKIAFSAALEECNLKKDGCSFYLRYMPDHPHYDVFVKQSESACKNQFDYAEGASVCTVVGAYFIKVKNYKSAYDNLSIDCAHNGLACLLIIGNQEFTETQKIAAAQQFCETQVGEYHSGVLQKKYCAQIKADHKIPKVLAEESAKTLQGFLEEQHSLEK